MQQKISTRGAISAGHRLTAEAGKLILEAGGNAFDAIIAAHYAACVAEPVFASLGGGGFLLAQTASQERTLVDFFVQTPQHKRPESEIDFAPIIVDFGSTQQEFHIGLGSIATPGAIKGMFEVHRRFGSMPMTELVQPAIDIARSGVTVNAQQAYLFHIVSPILTATPEQAEIFSGSVDSKVLQKGECLYMSKFADTLEALAREGEGLFYRGEIAKKMIAQCEHGGGYLRRSDLESYDVICREPLSFNYRGHQLLTNPPPSSGGLLTAFALELWEQLETLQESFGSFEHLARLVEVMALTNHARVDACARSDSGELTEKALLNDEMLTRYRNEIQGRAQAFRGTTHISVMDKNHNVATMTVSNGEGCGSLIPETGIILNNMLGEEDLNPGGFHLWNENQRMTSMMAPTIINRKDDSQIALGSGGSNRIRTAILQTVINQTDFKMSLEEAVNSPRIHFENEYLNVEAGFCPDHIASLFGRYPNHKEWESLNLFFGGVHAVMQDKGHFQGVGDLRRDGVCITL